jgi:hypothetical protein
LKNSWFNCKNSIWYVKVQIIVTYKIL